METQSVSRYALIADATAGGVEFDSVSATQIGTNLVKSRPEIYNYRVIVGHWPVGILP